MNIIEIKNKYESGISLTKLAKIYNTTRGKLTRSLKKIGVEIINKHNTLKFNEYYFDSIDTEEKAYWLGFIFADGCIMSNTYSFELTLGLKDKNHIDKFIRSINYSGKIYTKKHSVSCCLRSKHLWTTLNNYGCTPKKSLTLNFPELTIFKNRDLLIPFIRGYFDGDGCITQHIHPNIVSPHISLLGTKKFLEELINNININGNFRHDKRHSDNTFSLNFCKESGIKFINLIYSNSNIYLDRKYSKFLFFKNGSRSIQEWIELLSGKIGEIPLQENAEVNIEIKEFISPYSVDDEPV